SQRRNVGMQRARAQQLWIKSPHHRGARARRTNDGFGFFEDPKKSLGTGTRLSPIAGVERRLSTTGLRFRKVDFAADPSQHSDGVHRNLRQQLVNKARYEQRDFASHGY